MLSQQAILTWDWLTRYLCYQEVEQVYLMKW